MSNSPQVDRASSRRSVSKNASYADITVGSDSDDEEEILLLQTSRYGNHGAKRIQVILSESEDSEDGSGLDDEEYEIDYIVDSRFRNTRGNKVLEFLIHWSGYDVSDRSWTAADQFDDDDPPVEEFYRKHPKKPRVKIHTDKDHGETREKREREEKKDKETTLKKGSTPVRKRSLSTDEEDDVRAIHSPSSAPSKTEKQVQAQPGKTKKKPFFGDVRSYLSGFSYKSKPEDKGVEPKKSSKPSKPSTESTKTPKGKENIPVQAKRKSDGLVLEVKKKKARIESDDDDFAMEEDAAPSDEDDDDMNANSAQSDGEDKDDEDVQSGGLESMDEDDVAVNKPAKKNPGWGKGKTVKKPTVSLGNFRPAVKPLGNNVDIKNAIKNLSEDLPPMNDIETMFDHLVSRLPNIVKLVEKLNGRKLRVATMCSGTESPLLALNMIAKAVKARHGLTLSFDHVFSCEIEPFKQAYIERNFSPPILFRDVTELGNKRAHTAYGSLVPVPGNVDLLIAGTSCVDYSNLNNKQQTIEANGESGRTFRGMIEWVKKHQPPIVILENVCSAPWDDVIRYFADVDYDAQYVRLDTKQYYIPHTRTRVYLFATPSTSSSAHLSEKWAATVKAMARPWSAPFEAFLLHTDDPHIHRARLDLASAKEHKDGTQRKTTDWNRCESRHQRARQEEQLGLLRPLTSWQEAGVCKGLDWTWNDWLLAQTERVLDLLEISTLRMAKDGIDSGFKACIWNLSQNVDRQAGTGKTALAPCLTPNMIPWVTSRGGPVTGREALALQGIPVRELLLTSESEDQLADLAGNAMTTTVVGASMLAALQIALERLRPGEDAKGDAAKIEEELATADDQVAERVIGEDALEEHELDLAKVATADLTEILDLAARSSRHCQCEGQSGTASPIEECTACGYRACKPCGGRPDHQYEPCRNVRIEPTEFEKRFKELLPMRVQIAGLTLDSLTALREKADEMGKGTVDEKDWTLWRDAVVGGVEDAEFRFRYLKRGYTWTAVYESPNATLDLFIQGRASEWRLTIKAAPSEPVNSRLRGLLLHPIARLRLGVKGQDVLCGPWELCIPSRQSFKIDIEGAGQHVPTWHVSLGLVGEFDGKARWSQLKITVPPEAEKALDRNLSGTYTLLPKCGQAMTSLHKKEMSSSEIDLPPLFMFLDPTRCGEADDDPYVFSTSVERLNFGTERTVIATLNPKWRESSKEAEKVRLDVRGGWVVYKEAHMTAVGGSDIAVVPNTNGLSNGIHRDSATYAIPKSSSSVSVPLENQGCEHAAALLSCRVPLDPAHSESMWRQNAWGEIDLLHQGNATFANLAWITERIPLLDTMSKWNRLADVDASGTACERCAPRAPKIHWIKRAGKPNKNGGKTKSFIIAFEDKLEAGRYEHALKNRPAPFVVQLRLDEQIGRFRIGLNIMSLAHRALSRLPLNTAKGQIKLSWRLTPGQVADVPRPPRVFVLSSNKKDPQYEQPEEFLLPLRKEQLRSLWWMLEQERATGNTHTFIEEEISEAALPALGWRAEGKAERPVMTRGGVIADQVGYGKTIISLALIAETRKTPVPDSPPPGLIDIKATLIIVPGHLSKQWPSEINRFTGKMFRTVVIQNMRDLQKNNISDLARADIIVMASEVFEADTYWSRFEYLSAQPEDWLNDKQGGRFFADRLDSAMKTLRTQVGHLVSEGGAEAAIEAMSELQKAAVGDAKSKREAQKTANFGKRMKGQAYRDRYDVEPVKKNQKVSEDEGTPEDEDDVEELEPMPVPIFRVEQGKFALGHSSVEKDITLLECPLMHMFRFRRVIADEFTYLDKRSLAALLRLSASYKWILSGTPPVGDFPAIRSIAAFMGIHLGIEEDAEGSAQAQRARAKEQTAAEKFHAFREVHSSAWHKRRDDLAQEFLDIFVRQNIAEIEDIPTVEHIHPIQLPAAECAVYLELEHHLQALEMQARKETKFKNVSVGDRNARLEEALADSRTAEEALLKRCCHFTLDLTDKKRDAASAMEACRHISGARSTQLKGCEGDLERSINIAVGLHIYIRKKGFYGKDDDDRQHFKEWVDFSFDKTKHQGDAEAARRLVKVLEKCGIKYGVFPSGPIDGHSPKIEKKAAIEDVKWQLREQAHLLRRLSKELVARVRSLRFFDVVRRLQQNGEQAVETLEGSECSHKPSTRPGVEMAVLSCCGHVSCHKCMLTAADQQRCVKGDDCHAAVRHTNIVKVRSLGIEGELSSGRFGAKLQKLVDLIKSIPKDQRVLVFLQWEDLSSKVSEALTSGHIKHVTLSGTVKSKANTLDRFQTSTADSERVLLLKMNDASAAGSNLTTANHAIFLGPLYTHSLFNYRATETQAIGRVRRYGQSRKVHVHRLLTVDTIDMTIFNTRRNQEKAKPDYVEIPVEEFKGKKLKE